MPHGRYEVTPVGVVSSTLTHPSHAPRQGGEGAPDACLVIDPETRPAMAGIAPGDRLLVLTWLHAARRDVLAVHPRGYTAGPITGVFSTRSPDRPNPIGLHPVTVIAVEDNRIHVSGIEAVDGTPVLDLKPVIRSDGPR